MPTMDAPTRPRSGSRERIHTPEADGSKMLRKKSGRLLTGGLTGGLRTRSEPNEAKLRDAPSPKKSSKLKRTKSKSKNHSSPTAASTSCASVAPPERAQTTVDDDGSEKPKPVIVDDPYVAEDDVKGPLRIVAQKRYAQKMVYVGSGLRRSPLRRPRSTSFADDDVGSSASEATDSGKTAED